MTAPAITPLIVWDTREKPRPLELHWEQATWARKLFPQHADDTFRAEFYLIDTPFVVLYRFAENDEGRRYLDPATGEPAEQEPLTVILRELPPQRLLGGGEQ